MLSEEASEGGICVAPVGQVDEIEPAGVEVVWVREGVEESSEEGRKEESSELVLRTSDERKGGSCELDCSLFRCLGINERRSS